MKKFVIGITGSLGSGKSTVAAMFRKMGAGLISADRLAADYCAPGKPAHKKITNFFGKDILKAGGGIDREKLAQIVFKNKKSLKALNSFTHPLVKRRIKELIKKSSRAVVVIDVPLLIEAGLTGLADIVIVVKSKRDIQIKRCVKKEYSKEGARLRIRCQLPLAKKLKVADFIIDNSGTIKATEKKVKKIWREVKNDIQRKG